MSERSQPLAYVRRRSLAGPIILIAVGVIFLLGNMHVLTWRTLFYYWARYWPVLIIIWGLIKLIEYWQDKSQGLPTRGVGFGGYFLLFWIVVFGMAASSAQRVNWYALGSEIDMDDDFLGFFGNSYTYSQTLEQPYLAGAALRVANDRGDINLIAWDENKIKVVVNKKVVAPNESEAKKTDDATQPTISAAEGVVTVNANTSGAGNNPVQSNLEIYLPRKAAADISTRRGDVTIRDREGEIKVNNSRGDVTAENVTGNLRVELRRGSVRANNIKGDLSIDGRVDDTTINDVTGAVRLNGDFFGEMNLSRIAKTVAFKSSRTDMELASLQGELTMSSGDLRAKSVIGPVRLLTRSKDIHLGDISGDVRIENSNGVVELNAAKLPLGGIEINNRRGDIRVTLPAKAAFEVDARARRGDINSEFEGIQVNTQRDDSRASGTVGSGGPRLQLANDNGNIDIRKTTVALAPSPPTPPPPPAPRSSKNTS